MSCKLRVTGFELTGMRNKKDTGNFFNLAQMGSSNHDFYLLQATM